DYCLAYGENATKEWITGLKMSGVNHTSGNDNGFGNHTDQNIVVTPGLIYDINLTGQIDKKSANEYWTVWIDTNLNRIFEPEEIVFSESYGSIGSLETDVIVASGKVWVDYDFPIATTRLRVALSYKNPMETCDIITYGEVEDYTCTIQYLKTGLNQMEQDDLLRFDIAPNPAKNKVNIHYFHPQQEEVQVKLFAPNGRLLQQHRLTEQPNYAHTFELNMGDLPSGLYLVQLQTGGAIQTRKLMIME
ncbi:MAG: T9SS type A sorting domain-containing protein, partial [Chitinophagales bacterium]